MSNIDGGAALGTSQSSQIAWDEHPGVLEPKHIQQILNIGQKQTYELLNREPFKIVKVGRLIKVSRDVFRQWLEGQ